MHLIDKHMYPKNYFFAVTKEGIDGRSSLLLEGGHHRRRSSASQAENHKTVPRRQSLRQQQPEGTNLEYQQHQSSTSLEEEPLAAEKPQEKGGDTDMTDLTSAMSILQFAPTSVRFGRGKGRAGFAKR